LALSRTAHLTTAAKFGKKFTSGQSSRVVGAAIRKSPSVELWLFEALLTTRRKLTGTTMAHSVLNFRCFAHSSFHDEARYLPHHGSKNVAKNSLWKRGSRVVGAADRK